MSKKKPNPNKVPRTQADVDKAFQDGINTGAELTINLFLYALVDKHNASQEELDVFAKEVNGLAESINEGYLSFADVQNVLKKEYKFVFEGIRRRVR